jgi:putative membrane protein
VNPAPRDPGRASFPSRIAYLILAGGQQAALGLLLSMSPRLLYPSYGGGAGLWGLVPIEDQTLGGLIMWTVATLMGLLALMVLFYRFLLSEERRGALVGSDLVESRLP